MIIGTYLLVDFLWGEKFFHVTYESFMLRGILFLEINCLKLTISFLDYT